MSCGEMFQRPDERRANKALEPILAAVRELNDSLGTLLRILRAPTQIPSVRQTGQLLDTLLKQGKADQNDSNIFQRRSLRVQWFLFAATAAAFGAAAYYACIAYRQWQATEDTLRQSIESFRIDERAWVEIGSIKHDVHPIPKAARLSLPIKRMFIYTIYPKNVGKTAAYEIAIRVTDSSGTYDLGSDKFIITVTQDRLLVGKEVDKNTGKRIVPTFDNVPKVLGPEMGATAPYTIGALPPIDTVTADTHTSVREYSYLIGRIDYRDAFRVAHWMKFCFCVIGGQGELQNCKEGNDEDRNPEMPDGRH